MGATFKVGDIPADLVDSAAEWREKLLEQVAEMDDDVMEKYLDVSLIGLHAVADKLIPHVEMPTFLVAGMTRVYANLHCYLAASPCNMDHCRQYPVNEFQYYILLVTF